ncbi:VCBS domain-containing protein [Vibrio chagasii]|nr:VCBS domain-containing protein [Vibrio chagasii]
MFLKTGLLMSITITINGTNDAPILRHSTKHHQRPWAH